jgi:hypothetical protein
VVIIKPYDGLVLAESVELNKFDAWVQIHKLPIAYRDHALIKNLMEKKVGKALTVETVIPGVNNFVQVQVKFDVRKVLARFVTFVRGGQREFFQLKYEKFSKFCVHVVSLGILTLNLDLVNIMKMISNGGIGSKLIGQHGMAVVLRLIGVVDVLVMAERRLAWEEVEVLEVEVSLQLAGDLMFFLLYVVMSIRRRNYMTLELAQLDGFGWDRS